MHENKENSDDIFISEFFDLNDELDELDVFDAIINSDSNFFINLLRLKNAKTPEFQKAYNRINEFFRKIMLLLDNSKQKNDKLYNSALKLFDFHGIKGINLGHSKTGIDAAFGPILSAKVINDAFEIVKSGSTQPEIFQLVGLFEAGVGADLLSDMIATIILPDIREYTQRINKELCLNPEQDPEISVQDGIAINPYKSCELLYLPTEILHKIPIARCWDDIDRVIAENQAIRDEVNQAIGAEWYKMHSNEKKDYLKRYIFKDPTRCRRLIDGYRKEEIDEYSLINDWEYFIADAFKQMKKSGAFEVLEHSDKSELSSWDASIEILNIFKEWVECNKGWDEILSTATKKREKSVQKMLQLSGKYFCVKNNVDMSFEANEGPGPVDLKISRGNDKTVIEIKLSSNADYLHGYEEQIEDYAKAEGTDKRIFVYVQVGNPKRDETIQKRHQERLDNGSNPPLLFMIDAQKQTSASKD